MNPRGILIVDDNPDVVSFVRRVLTAQGYEVESALSAEEARRLLDAEPVAVVLVDLVLPGMGGMELAWRLVEKDSHPAVILMSGYADGDAAVASLNARGVSFLAKPFTADDLLARVREHLPTEPA